MDFTVQRPKIILFGDSLTERGFAVGGWAAGLANHFFRKADIINRGFGGYNTRWASMLMPDVFAGSTGTDTRLVALFFGANDAAKPDGPPHSAKQHVPVAEFTRNLASMVAYVRSLGIHTILLITPPPVYDQGRKDWQHQKMAQAMSAADIQAMPLDRTNAFVQQYAVACCNVAKELGLPCVDLYSGMQATPGWRDLYFVDGLHFNAEGNQFVLEAVLKALQADVPILSAEAMPLHMPSWDAITPGIAAQLPGILEAMRQQGPFKPKTLPTEVPHPADGKQG